jgi:hypothetical protein
VPLGDQRQRLRVREHVVDVRVGGMPGDAEEPHPDRLVGDLFVQLVQRGAVTGLQRPDHRDRPVGQQNIGRRQLICHGHATTLGRADTRREGPWSRERGHQDRSTAVFRL